MSRLLTDRQAEELHKSIIAYFSSIGLSNTAAALRTDLNLGEETFDAATSKKYEGLLEKKWTSVVRLQKKVMDLENQNRTLKFELENATPLAARLKQDPATWLPKDPARYTLESHQKDVTCVAFHPVFSSLASGSDDCTIKIWDWEMGEIERTVKGHTRTVTDLDFGGPQGGTILASCSSDLTIKLWDPSKEYQNIRTLHGHDHSVSAVRFIPSGVGQQSGNLLVSASRDETMRMWDVTTGYCVKTIHGHTDWIRDISPSVDGRYLVSTGDDKTGRLWDISGTMPECKVILTGHDNYNICCVLAPAAAYKFLAPLAGLQKPPPATSTAEFIATGSRDKVIKLWDARGNCIKTLVGHDNWIRALVFHPGGKYLISASDDKSIRCWDLSQEGKCVRILEDIHGHFVTSLRWAPSIMRVKQNGQPTPGTPNGKAIDVKAESETQIRWYDERTLRVTDTSLPPGVAIEGQLDEFKA
ncbi:WD40 repeat-like protein [Glarea lozoyensis ATCC 20868]|uniref:Nuclear distribution protein PAC1 n=1 Tax=Glarea lozoyensis (strain ATCC 20868 / MF5171) TaxID=1116229 RepID=S3CVZ1_GLAL2|nr:WD40 repeat-like protein [Glarea lozoyensis ATCC 20868]EPE30582.1 WD40 repeat-like protein [Glarea lozoyensis ATCC 20868]